MFRNSKGLILRIGSRKSPNYYRVYEKENGLEFELEMKKEALDSFQELLFSNRLEDFEKELSKHFYRHSKSLLALDTCYTDWLVTRLRKTVEKQKPSDSLITGYLEHNSLDSLAEAERFFRFLQFLSFIRDLKGSKHSLGNQVYYLCIGFSTFYRY